MRKRSFVLALLLAASAAGSPAPAAFQQPLVSPRAAALSDASLPGKGDSTSLFVNPAGLASLEGSDAYFTYNQLYAGMQGTGSMSDGFMTFAAPTKFGSVAAGVGTFRAAGLLTERTIAVGWARSLGKLDFGVAGKSLYHSYSVGSDPAAAADPVFSHGSGRGAFSLDLGAIYHAAPALDFGLAVRNVNSPDVGLASLDRVPREIQGAAAYEWRRLGLRLTGDLVYRDAGWGTAQDKLTPGVGLEKWLAGGRAAFRVGLSSLGASAGVGLRLGRLEFDYALVVKRNLMSGSYGTHLVGLRWRFGGPSGYAVRSAAPARAVSYAPDPSAPTAALATDVPGSY